MKNKVVRGADILLPADHTDADKWAVVAVDQYTSQPDYWRQVEQTIPQVQALRDELQSTYEGLTKTYQ